VERHPGVWELKSRLREFVRDYKPWRKVKHIARDKGVDAEELWTALKFERWTNRREIDLLQSNGRPFVVTLGSDLLEPLHRVDRATGGGGAASLTGSQGLLSDESHRTRLRIRTLMDEAAESSLIEGAATTRKEAVELLRQARPPKSKGERMVVNNYVAMQSIKASLRQELSIDMLCELQTVLTRGTLEREDEAGRFRRPDEHVRVVDDRTPETVYVPPPAAGIRERVKKICEFANREHRGAEFLHPIMKASILHFMIGYEHPFVDGNGRTARAVFYWHALRNGYDIFEFIPISERIRKGFARYPQAYLDTVLDDGDLTYFILYKLDIIESALDDLAMHLKREEEKIRQSERLLRISKDLNLRQRLLLEHALRHPTTLYTAKSHSNSNGIAINTARSDLEELAKKRLVVKTKRGKEIHYHAAPGLHEKLARKERE
jgi:Fic family protein